MLVLLRSIFLKLADSNSELSQTLGEGVNSVDTLLPALKDLFDSPIVYVWDYSTLRSCKVTNNSFEEYQLNNESLIQLAITIDLGITETRQRGI